MSGFVDETRLKPPTAFSDKASKGTVPTLDNKAFHVLGIEPTGDGRAIRAAFLRLARIYHPDRFAGQPDDVRAEAERRMKEATVAYEALRGARQKSAAARASFDDKELQERARAFAKIVEAKQAEEKRNRARWQRWQELELQARARAEVEAEIAAAIAEGDGVPFRTPSVHRDEENPSDPKRGAPASAFAQRLDAARRGETSPLVRRVPQQD
jgi:curved DNA-binding protein CbpA